MLERKAISLSYEIQDLTSVLEGARVLAEAVRTDQLATEHDTELAPTSVISILTLAIARLQLLDAVVRGQMTAARLWTAHNDTRPTPLPGDDRDVRLRCAAREENTDPTPALPAAPARAPQRKKKRSTPPPAPPLTRSRRRRFFANDLLR